MLWFQCMVVRARQICFAIQKYGADYEKVLGNVARLIKMRDDAGPAYPTIGLRAILFKWNDSDKCLEWFRRDAATLGLEAHWGHHSTNNYHWIHDGNGLGDRAFLFDLGLVVNFCAN